eukprot:2136715-Lingulodinium_polyedra.AAC.1
MVAATLLGRAQDMRQLHLPGVGRRQPLRFLAYCLDRLARDPDVSADDKNQRIEFEGVFLQPTSDDPNPKSLVS